MRPNTAAFWSPSASRSAARPRDRRSPPDRGPHAPRRYAPRHSPIEIPTPLRAFSLRLLEIRLILAMERDQIGGGLAVAMDLCACAGPETVRRTAQHEYRLVVSAITGVGPRPSTMSARAQAMLATLSRTPGALRGSEAGRSEISGIDAEMEMLRCMAFPLVRHQPQDHLDQRLGVLAPSDEIQAAGVSFWQGCFERTGSPSASQRPGSLNGRRGRPLRRPPRTKGARLGQARNTYPQSRLSLPLDGLARNITL